MKRLTIIIALLIASTGWASAQTASQLARKIFSGTGVPTLNCTPGPIWRDVYVRTGTGIWYQCTAAPNTWTPMSGYDGGAVTNPVLGPNGSASAPTYSFSTDTNTGMFRSGADAIGFTTGGTERWVINSSGAFNPFIDNTYDIGNGSVNPRDVNISRKLIVGKAATNTGQIDFAGTTSGVVSVKPADAAGTWTMTLPANDGDASQYLQTNGSGVTSWQTVTAGIGGTTGATDNAVLRADGTGGATAQNSVVTITDAGEIRASTGDGSAPAYSFINFTNSGLSYYDNGLVVNIGGAAITYTKSTGTLFGSGMRVAWSDNANPAASPTGDIGLTRAAADILEVNNGSAGTLRDLKVRQHYVDATITAGGTTGAQTINKAAGSVNFAGGASTLVVTNSLVTANSLVFCTVQTNDAAAIIKNVVPASGSFTITLNAAASSETKVAFLVVQP